MTIKTARKLADEALAALMTIRTERLMANGFPVEASAISHARVVLGKITKWARK